MRSDMYKVIVERPRVGGNIPLARKKKVWGEGEDFRKYESMKYPWSYDRKGLNENLSPLRRFFESRVGNHYNDVWSELCQFLDDKSAIKKHVKDHARNYIGIRILE